jgi:hypothetical protein
MYRTDETTPELDEARDPQLPFDVGDVLAAVVTIVAIPLSAFGLGGIVGLFAAGVVITFRALT